MKTTYGKDAKTEPFTGVTLKAGSLVLSQVLRNGPAWNAGIVLNDEIVAINGLKVTAAGFEPRIKDFKAGDTIKVTLFSNDRLKDIELKLGEKQSGKLAITSVEKPSRSQKAFFKAWLGVDWPFDKEGKLQAVK